MNAHHHQAGGEGRGDSWAILLGRRLAQVSERLSGQDMSTPGLLRHERERPGLETVST